MDLPRAEATERTELTFVVCVLVQQAFPISSCSLQSRLFPHEWQLT